MTANSRTGARILVDQLLIQGARYAFGVPGESYLTVLDAMSDVAGRLDYIVCRHEAAASNMAEAYGKLTGTPGVAFVTRAPGATHAATGLFTARQDSTPMILFIGQVARPFLDREAWQELDYRRAFGQMAKWVGQVDDARRLPEMISRAFHQAVNGRPGPVVLALPEDMLRDDVVVADARPVRRNEIAPGQDALQALRDSLTAARRPLLIVGGGGWTAAAWRDLTAFAERWSLPVVVSFRRQDLLDNRHPLYVGELGPAVRPTLVDRIAQSDLLIVLGTRLGEVSTNGYKLLEVPCPAHRLVHIHADPDELGRVYAADLAMVATPAGFLTGALGLPPFDVPWHGWAETLRRERVEWGRPAAPRGTVDLAAVVAGLAERLPPDTIVTNGAGNYTVWLHRFYQYRGFRTQLAPTSGAMGYGVPAAIAAKLTRPQSTVVAFAGDGCFLMSGQELITAVAHRLPIIFLVVNNQSYGTIRMHQERVFPGRVYGTDLVNPDFVALARAYGAAGERVQATDDVWPCLDRALAHPGPTLIELVTDIEQLSPQATVSALRAAAKRTPAG
jgi:acetolactate synthase-1/2/3 large subunit